MSKLYSLKPGLKKARKAANLTQQQLADKMDVTLKTVMNWEQGLVNPPLETVIQLADMLYCDIDFLVGRIECRDHDVQFIHDQTGLSEKSITELIAWKRFMESHPGRSERLYPVIVSQILEDREFNDVVQYIGNAIKVLSASKSEDESIPSFTKKYFANDARSRAVFMVSNYFVRIIEAMLPPVE